MRSIGSSIVIGTANRAGANWLPARSAVSSVRTLIGIVMRKRVDLDAVAIVVAAQAAGDGGDERVVELAVHLARRRLHLVERHDDRVEPDAQRAAGHERAQRRGRGRQHPRHGPAVVAGSAQGAGSHRGAARPRRSRPIATTGGPGPAAGAARAAARRPRARAGSSRGPRARRASSPRSSGGVALEVEQVHRDLHRADAVGDRVMDLDDQAGAPFGEVVDDDELPQRPRPVEALHRDRLRHVEQVAQRPVAARPRPPQVVVAGRSSGRPPIAAARSTAGSTRPAGAAAARAGWPGRGSRPGGSRSGDRSSTATAVIVDRSCGSFSIVHMSASASLMRCSNRIDSAIAAIVVRPTMRTHAPCARPARTGVHGPHGMWAMHAET